MIERKKSFTFEGWTQGHDYVYSFECHSIHDAGIGLSRLATIAREMPSITHQPPSMVV